MLRGIRGNKLSVVSKCLVFPTDNWQLVRSYGRLNTTNSSPDLVFGFPPPPAAEESRRPSRGMSLLCSACRSCEQVASCQWGIRGIYSQLTTYFLLFPSAFFIG